MISEELREIIDTISGQEENAFLDSVTEEQIAVFEKKNNIKLPEKYREWLLFSDGGELYLPSGIQLYGVVHKPIIDISDSNIPNNDYIVIGAFSWGDSIVFKKNTEEISIYNHLANKIEKDETYNNFDSFLQDLPNILGEEANN